MKNEYVTKKYILWQTAAMLVSNAKILPFLEKWEQKMRNLFRKTCLIIMTVWFSERNWTKIENFWNLFQIERYFFAFLNWCNDFGLA